MRSVVDRAPRRDELLDLLRVASLFAIVADHWLGSKVWHNGGRVGANLVLTNLPALAPATWVLVANPVLFFVGGAANTFAFERCRDRDGTMPRFVAARLVRLSTPVAAFAATWLVIQFGLHIAHAGGTHLIRGVSGQGTGPFGPLWFIAVYMLVILTCPWAVKAHRRHGLRVVWGLAIGVLLVDAVRFGGHVPVAGWLNVALVWLVPHQLGICYAHGTLDRMRPAAVCAVFVSGAAALVILSRTHMYPTSIQGVPGAGLSNMDPPTAFVLAQITAQLGLVLMVAPRLRRLLQHAEHRAWLRRTNDAAMSIYVWHMTALVTAAWWWTAFGIPSGGYSISRTSSLAPWTVKQPLLLAASSLLLVVMVWVMGPLESFGRDLQRMLWRSKIRAPARP